MNKTVTINISGIIFHIEEDAFDKLSRYLSTIKGYFNNTDGRDEIMSDIESRIAEMLQEKVNKVKQVVLMNDVNDVIAIMGQPEDFAGDNENHQSTSYTAEPTYTASTGKRKRVFRDPDDKVLGGVCSGIAAYFDIDALWLRIGWAISFFFFGFGFLLYILLWIIIPKATTTAEKLEMRGERVNINNIQRSINEELEDLKKKVNDFKNEGFSPDNKRRARGAVHRFVDFLIIVLTGFFKIIGKVFAAFFTLIAFVILFALIAAFFNATNAVNINENGHHYSFTFHEIAQFFFANRGQQTMATIGLMLLLCIPLIMAIYHAIRYLLHINYKNRYVSIVAGLLWITGLTLTLISGLGIAKEFKAESKTRENLPVMQPAGNTLYIQTNSTSDYFNDEDDDIKLSNVDTKDGKMFLDNPKIDIVKSETDSFQVYVIKTSQGANKKEAYTKAQKIDYSFSQKDSVIIFNNSYSIDMADKWRDQDVKILVKVPVNKNIYLSNNMRNVLYDVDNVKNIWDGDMVGRKWVMTSDGLDCVTCEGLDQAIRIR